MITVSFLADGKYALAANNGLFLSETSELKANIDDSCKFTIDFFQQMVAFRSASNSIIIHKTVD